MNAPANIDGPYCVRTNGIPGQFMVFFLVQNVPWAGPLNWEKANDLADHMNASSRLSRQQNEAEGDEPEPTPHRVNRWSVGDYQNEASRRTR